MVWFLIHHFVCLSCDFAFSRVVVNIAPLNTRCPKCGAGLPKRVYISNLSFSKY